MNYGSQVAETSVAPSRQTEVQGELDAMQANVKCLYDVVERLENRLSPILAQRAETGQNSTGTPEPVRVPLASALFGQNNELRGLNTRLGSILERIEL